MKGTPVSTHARSRLSDFLARSRLAGGGTLWKLPVRRCGAVRLKPTTVRLRPGAAQARSGVAGVWAQIRDGRYSGTNRPC